MLQLGDLTGGLFLEENDELNRQLPEGGLPSFQPCFDRRVDKTWSNPLIEEKPSPEDP